MQALCGTTLTVPTIEGPTMRVPITDIMKPTSEKRISGKGLPHSKTPNHRGDLILKFDISFPDYVNGATKEILKDCLP